MKHKKQPKVRVQLIEHKGKYVRAEENIDIVRMRYPKIRVKSYIGILNGEPFYVYKTVKDFNNPIYEVVKTIKKGYIIREKRPDRIIHDVYNPQYKYEVRIPVIKGIRQVLEAAEMKYGKGQQKKSRHYAKAEAKAIRERNKNKLNK